ncbi:toll/interleukin-1 receptor (TIR) domain-containing protein [Artemisia annua]|uniref:ADP-ribosyl cyclase/cyclic ADP-ribose hydrolase n=1 Tax=Artemisia annua TaxID=35608 RepID=A0A2U1LSG2_ARTAN|nr:toll/interleukin-1 receptor (TIR) domain-containing protein [Artemisia annua]
MAIINEIQEEEEQQEESKTYDVFLSFRGIDTRLNFTDYLHEALVNENITTFLDGQEVGTGEELKPELTRAIKGSRASIIVLSKNYASSSWCLDELVLILKQRKVSKHTVVPIFYHVEPTHVRKQESSFGEAIFKHRQRMEAEPDEEKKKQAARKLESWTEALKEVADLKGKDVNGRREMMFIEEIVKEIRSRLNIHMKTKIPHLIGMESYIDTIRSWMKGGDSNTTEILTIWGMSGIGKTSLANYIFGLHRHEFGKSSFVEDIGRKCEQQSSTLVHLQNKLLKDISNKHIIEEDDVQNCTSKIETILLKKRTLVVLDGVDNFEQVHVLVGREGFHPGSKIIITTTDGSVTDTALLLIKHPPKHTKLALNGLHSTDSLRLFCWHAFGGYSPKEGYEEDAIRASKYCEGHPLALKVLGSFLLNAEADTWSYTFTMLESREFQIKNVHKVLRIGFDSLPSDCKELFKHIACFFVGKETEVTEAILKDCGIHPSYGIKKLIERSLLTIGVEEELKMHQLLQDMGRDIVRQESPDNPWKRSQVWNHKESLNILQEDKGTKKIHGLFFDMKMYESSLCGSSSAIDHKFEDIDLSMNFGVDPSFNRLLEFSSSRCRNIELSTNALNKMEKLKLLQLNHIKLNGSFKKFPKGLRGLCMHGFQSEYIPSGLPMEHLVALDMSFSNLKQLWRKPKLLGSLKYLNLSYSKLVTVGGFKELPALERLILRKCESLAHVCESIGECDSLVALNLSYCSKLKNLPISISKLKNLTDLTLDGCGAGVFDKERKRMKLLNVPNKDGVSKKLQAFFSSNTRLVPNSQKSISLSLPSSLVTLSLTNNNLSSESFPADFSSMSMLRKLFLDYNPIDSIPDCIKTLNRLEVLSVGGCSKLKSVLFPSSTIKRLYADKCDLLEKITLHQDMSAPPLICFINSVSLSEIEGIMKIQDLAQVDNEIISSLGWTDIHYVKDYEVESFNFLVGFHSKKLPVKVLSQSLSFSFRISLCFQICKNVMQIGFYLQMLYECGIFSTCFPGKEVPKWFAHRSNGSSISFTMPSASANKRIEGINICFVQAFSVCLSSSKHIQVKNITKDRSWRYHCYMGAIGYAGEGLVWLSHWMFGNNELEAGDEISVTIERWVYEDHVMVTECGMSPVYSDRDKESVDPLSYYRSRKHIVGGDLFHWWRSYDLDNYNFCPRAHQFKTLFSSETRFKKSFDNASRVPAQCSCGLHAKDVNLYRGTVEVLSDIVSVPSMSKFEFQLRLQEFIELGRGADKLLAVKYARKHLVPWAATYMKEFHKVFVTLVSKSDTGLKKYKLVLMRCLFEFDTLRDWEYKFITKYAKVGTIKTPETTPDINYGFTLKNNVDLERDVTNVSPSLENLLRKE